MNAQQSVKQLDILRSQDEKKVKKQVARHRLLVKIDEIAS